VHGLLGHPVQHKLLEIVEITQTFSSRGSNYRVCPNKTPRSKIQVHGNLDYTISAKVDTTPAGPDTHCSSCKWGFDAVSGAIYDKLTNLLQLFV